jgi:ATP-binding cassette, subfamily F, member 3
MLLTVDVSSKTIGNKHLFSDLQFAIEPGEKVAIIGRNGVGKTTLFRMLVGEDTDFYGHVRFKKGSRIVSTAQEHHAVSDHTVLDYILNNLPDYARLKHILDTYPDTMGDDLGKITTYTNALEQFSQAGYYYIEDAILLSLIDYQIPEELSRGPLSRLSGGQKRFVELVRIEHADADVALIDEPTNHMDFMAKAAFIEWFKAVRRTVILITHDRDVLKYVDKIIEIKDQKARVFPGNYDSYLKQNAATTATAMHDYEIGTKTLANLHKQIQAVRAKKASTSKTPNPFIPLERRLMKESNELEANLHKPNFWIDRESAGTLNKKASENYEKYKAKNIHMHANHTTEGTRELLNIDDVQLGYGEQPLFAQVRFRLQHGDRLQLIGRNGAGKTTLVRAIVDASVGKKPATLRNGHITVGSKLRLSVYEQEINPALLELPLYNAVERIYHDLGQPVNEEIVMRTLGNYLFNPQEDKNLLVTQLSGGQKARLQLIRMLAANPNLLILDEPTNHLDLPSIEELEHTLANYHGALLYVSHDSYFAKNIGGEQLRVQPVI